jgi:hypothetical protein
VRTPQAPAPQKNDFAVNDFAKPSPLPNHGKRSWTELTEFGKFTALRKTPSAVLPEEWRRIPLYA